MVLVNGHSVRLLPSHGAQANDSTVKSFLFFGLEIWKPTHCDAVDLHQGEEAEEKIGGDTPVAGESMLQVNQVFTLEQIARTASMHKRVTSAAEKHKRVYIAVPSLWPISQ